MLAVRAGAGESGNYTYVFGGERKACPPAFVELDRTEETVCIQYGLRIEAYRIDENGLEIFRGYI